MFSSQFFYGYETMNNIS